MKKIGKLLILLVVLLAALFAFRMLFGGADMPDDDIGTGQDITQDVGNKAVPDDDIDLPNEDGTYDSKEDVALYLWVYGELPDNYITKKEAQKLGWNGGALEPYAPGCCIGGDRFGNYEGVLPDENGVTYTECDIDTLGKKRGAKRLVFSSDGYIYYTDDHYESFSVIWFTDDYEMREEPVK